MTPGDASGGFGALATGTLDCSCGGGEEGEAGKAATKHLAHPTFVRGFAKALRSVVK